jgi:hypothetical protein
VLESGLKIHLLPKDSSYGAMSKIDLAYKRLLAIEESKKTGIPIVVVYDSFHNPFVAHGNQIATRDIEKQGLIPLNYDRIQEEHSPEVVNEVIDLKKKGVNIQSFNYSIGQLDKLTVTQLKEALEKDGIVEAGAIKDDGSNLVHYKSQIRDWLLNGKKGVYGPVMPGLEQLGLGDFRETISALDKLAANSIDFVNAAGNFGPSTINIFSFVKDGTPVGALNSKGQITDYTSKTSLIKENAVVKGNHIRIYEQGSGKIKHDYDGDWFYDEELSLDKEAQKALLKLDKLRLADKEVVQDLHALLTRLAADNSYKTQPLGFRFGFLFEGYVFKKEDLELIKKDIELIKQKNNDNPIMSELLIREINTVQKRFSGDIGSFYGNDLDDPFYYVNQMLGNPPIY